MQGRRLPVCTTGATMTRTVDPLTPARLSPPPVVDLCLCHTILTIAQWRTIRLKPDEVEEEVEGDVGEGEETTEAEAVAVRAEVEAAAEGMIGNKETGLRAMLRPPIYPLDHSPSNTGSHPITRSRTISSSHDNSISNHLRLNKADRKWAMVSNSRACLKCQWACRSKCSRRQGASSHPTSSRKTRTTPSNQCTAKGKHRRAAQVRQSTPGLRISSLRRADCRNHGRRTHSSNSTSLTSTVSTSR